MATTVRSATSSEESTTLDIVDVTMQILQQSAIVVVGYLVVGWSSMQVSRLMVASRWTWEGDIV
jgi:hypothetical protein